jgi:sugar phosphate isomerase/epimerase
MLRASVSERTTFRWDLADELDAVVRHGFDAISVWRPKLSDLPQGEARRMLVAAGVRVSSLQWAGGFTGSDGRSFRESLTDAQEAIYEAAELGTNVLLVHTGCRGGHTLGHARRLVQESLERLAPIAEEHGVRLALKPTHPAASAGCGFITELEEAGRFVDTIGHPSIGLALDVWHFGGERSFLSLLPSIVHQVLVVSLADCRGAPTADHERLAPGDGSLPLGRILECLAHAGFDGDVEFEFFAEPTEPPCHRPPHDAATSIEAGYHEALRKVRHTARSLGCAPRSIGNPLPAPATGR